MNYKRFDGLTGTEMAYRYVDRLVSAGVDEWDNPLGPGEIRLYCSEYEILSHTPKGFWIKEWHNESGKRFILKDAKRCFAHLTKEAALQSFVKRKHRQISILSAQIRNAERAVRLAKILLDKTGTPLL